MDTAHTETDSASIGQQDRGLLRGMKVANLLSLPLLLLGLASAANGIALKLTLPHLWRVLLFERNPPSQTWYPQEYADSLEYVDNRTIRADSADTFIICGLTIIVSAVALAYVTTAVIKTYRST